MKRGRWHSKLPSSPRTHNTLTLQLCGLCCSNRSAKQIGANAHCVKAQREKYLLLEDVLYLADMGNVESKNVKDKSSIGVGSWIEYHTSTSPKQAVRGAIMRPEPLYVVRLRLVGLQRPQESHKSSRGKRTTVLGAILLIFPSAAAQSASVLDFVGCFSATTNFSSIDTDKGALFL